MSRYVDPTEQLVTELYVRDVKISSEFYKQFGFEPVRELPDFAEFAWEGHRFMLEEQKDWPPVPEHPQANIRVMVPNVEDFWETAQEMGARVLKPIADREYGLRGFTITDPDGFAVRFATRLSDLGGD